MLVIEIISVLLISQQIIDHSQFYQLVLIQKKWGTSLLININDQRPELTNACNIQDKFNYDGVCFSSFRTLKETDEEVCQIIKSAHITLCRMDPLPSTVFKSSLDELIPVTTLIINHSLASGVLLTGMKHAILQPHEA